MEPLLLVDKPKGITSFDVIRRLRKELGIRKMGHAGTLDPLASGLMLIGVNEGTKLLASLIKLPKSYDAEIVLGELRSTGDQEGELLASCAVADIPKEEIEEALRRMVGTLLLPVPAYSAIKKNGVPLYKRARRGEEVETPVRPMEVTSATLTKVERHGDKLHLHVSFDVGSGTYIRSLAEKLGSKLGYPAALVNLRRTSIGEYRVEDARSV